MTEREALIELLFRLADDELVIGHRDSEWTGFAPHIEEDVAFSSISQDEIGHANLFFSILGDMGQGRPDDLAFLRQPAQFRNAVLLERPRGDWSFSIVRQYLYDTFDTLRLEALAGSTEAVLRDAAARLGREERYHLLHARTWMERLSAATPDALGRMQAALDAAWPEALGLFEATEADAVLLASGALPVSVDALRSSWLAEVAPDLVRLGLRPAAKQSEDGRWLPTVAAATGGRVGRHTADLDQLIADMTSVYRLDPEAVW